MNIKRSFLYLALTTIILFSGCSKRVEEYNKPAVYWYGKIIEYIAKGDLEKADNYYSSLQGEHIGSPLLPEATMILAIAHLHYEEYLLSEHFLNEYIRRYATINEKEAAEFLKIKAKYMALPNPRRDQALINQAIKEAQRFKKTYPNSMYYSIVDTMQTRLYMADAALNESIADLYDRIDKPKSAQFYREIEPQPWIKWDEIDRANTPWYREWFEGDGTQSWYGFIVPDTQSVVSRNSIKSLDAQDVKKEIKKVQQTPIKAQNKLDAYKQNELKKAKELRDRGIIDDEEFEKLKDKILNN
jgi:outer membrane protein assembly factor BamD